MNQEPQPTTEQSPGYDPKSVNKRHSGLFALFKWFKTPSHESINFSGSSTASSTSLDSTASDATIASFAFIPPTAYPQPAEKSVTAPPETDTYRARLAQRDRRRETDKNTTLKKKYNLSFIFTRLTAERASRSLPLMPKAPSDALAPKTPESARAHRRTNSDSSRTKAAGAYVHVKGKRRAPPPPDASMSLRRRKRLAPAPPVLSNDTLKLENGVLKPRKQAEAVTQPKIEPVAAARPVWYKRQSSVAEEKRKSNGLAYLTNISELDREAGEIVRKASDLPEFMRLKDEPKVAEPKRRSARDLIAKFNAITSVTKATVFGVQSRRDYFGRRNSEDCKKQESLLEMHKKRIEAIEKNGLMKSESANAIREKKADTAAVLTPKLERKRNWKCVKCNVGNEYWRIICSVCSAIKPYFDDFSKDSEPINGLERSKTQIGFSALASYDNRADEREKLKKMLIDMKNSLPKRKSNILAKQQEPRKSVIVENEEKTVKEPTLSVENKLGVVKQEAIQPTKKIADGMKADIKPKVIIEQSIGKMEDGQKIEIEQKLGKPLIKQSINKMVDETKNDQLINKMEDGNGKIAKIEPKPKILIVATQETVYENIKVKKVDEPLPIKVTTSVQTGAAPKRRPPEQTYELMRPKDFETIYSDSSQSSPAKAYANLARNDELSLFFQMPPNLEQMKAESALHSDTIEVNRLLRRLETSIAKGELVQAADYAKELAQLRVNCSVIRQRKECANKEKGFTVEMYVEDKISHRGPFSVEVSLKQTVAELKTQVEAEFEIPAKVQRWILGKELATNDTRTLLDHQITETCPIFLYLVAPEARSSEPKPSTSKADHTPKVVEVIPKKIDKSAENELVDGDKTLKASKEWECHLCTLLNPNSSNICSVCATVRIKGKIDKKQAPKAPQTYDQLVNLDNGDLVETRNRFNCLICYLEIGEGKGVTLRECLHEFCKECLAQTIEFSEDAEVRCPFRDSNYACQMALQEREIRALVPPAIYDQHLTKSIAEAENRFGKSGFHCKTPDCRGWCVFEDNVNTFVCPICRLANCLTCQAIHAGRNCRQYQDELKAGAAGGDETAKLVAEMVRKGEALHCPTCEVILMKKWGCDWVRCSMCKTEICWVTRGARWGKGGKGDTSGGCRCGVNGVKCHPQCSYCH